MSATLHIQVSDKMIKEFETVLFAQVFHTLYFYHTISTRKKLTIKFLPLFSLY